MAKELFEVFYDRPYFQQRDTRNLRANLGPPLQPGSMSRDHFQASTNPTFPGFVSSFELSLHRKTLQRRVTIYYLCRYLVSTCSNISRCRIEKFFLPSVILEYNKTSFRRLVSFKRFRYDWVMFELSSGISFWKWYNGMSWKSYLLKGSFSALTLAQYCM